MHRKDLHKNACSRFVLSNQTQKMTQASVDRRRNTGAHRGPRGDATGAVSAHRQPQRHGVHGTKPTQAGTEWNGKPSEQALLFSEKFKLRF